MLSKLIKSLLFCLLILGNVYAKPVYVLVHGAWHGGWCWQKVSAKLRAEGAVVYTPTLSGLGEHKNTLNADIDLNTHITDIVNLIVMEDLHDVILVGHSYGGIVIEGVAERIPERLNKLVFLDALVLENEESCISIQQKDAREKLEKSKGLSLPAWGADAYGVTDTADIRWVNERLVPQPYKTFSQPLVLKHPVGNNLPMVYIACLNPQLTVLKQFSDKTQHAKGWSYYELNTGHDAMVTMPNEFTALLLDKIK